MAPSIFSATQENPYHLSTGVVLTNSDGLVAVHHFKDHPELLKRTGLTELYLLMRETIEGGESIEQAAARGLMEEFGAEGDFVRYLGSRITAFSIGGAQVQKTVVYLVANVTSWDGAKRSKDDPEAVSAVEWHKPPFLISRMCQQGNTPLGSDIDESEVLERFMRPQRLNAK